MLEKLKFTQAAKSSYSNSVTYATKVLMIIMVLTYIIEKTHSTCDTYTPYATHDTHDVSATQNTCIIVPHTIYNAVATYTLYTNQ
ncbi:unnamed protein product [Schistosoma spindalis]|nr:unnamed protein product [Schistosoma spindale]